MIGFTGCAKQKQVTALSSSEAITAQSEQVTSVGGRAWVSIKSTSGNASFSGIIAVDRATAGKPSLRIEALDPFGGLHHLIVVNGASDQLIWVDYDNKILREGRKRWHGVPLRLFPHLFIGAVAPGRLEELGYGKVRIVSASLSQEKIDGFSVAVEHGEALDFKMSWIDPGPRLALEKLETIIEASVGGRKVKSAVAVSYSHFSVKKDYYLPSDMKLTVGSDFELKVSWRERQWNQSMDGELFTIAPEVTKGFSREWLR